ncbi:MAG: putative selenocysteine system protein [Candidatus Thorarchaeota archaeon]|jgi:hypothetical protein
MNDGKTEVSRSLNFSSDEPEVVFRLAWYVVASKPNLILEVHNEAESQDFQGSAGFSLRIAGEAAHATIQVTESKSSIDLTVQGLDEVALGVYLDDHLEAMSDALAKYQSLSEEDKSKLRRALVAKTCWDRVVREILNKAPVSDIYIQVAHGREMMIKATEGETGVSPVTLTTAAWLSKIESFPRDETMPGNIASELAKKSIEWKRETQDVICRYI